MYIVWDTIIIRPIINVLLLLYKFFGHETIIAVTLVTLIFRLILTPLQLNQQKTARKQRELQPRLKEIQAKYKDDKEKLAQEQMKLYKEIGVNPMGGCLTLIIQLPIMLGLYQAIIRALASTPLQLLSLPKDIYSWIPGLVALIPLKSQFLWLDLALPDQLYVLPVLVVISAWFYQKLITPPPADAQAAAMNKQMMIMMPLMTCFFSATYASGLAVYFLISNLVGILQYYLFRQHYQFDEPVAAISASTKPARLKDQSKK
ncbi:MAG: membrane protein insertase YidC [Anaerolineales bacterium]|nr:MAG: membrane protein insertase YidC [Anaerolineales bacterium]